MTVKNYFGYEKDGFVVPDRIGKRVRQPNGKSKRQTFDDRVSYVGRTIVGRDQEVNELVSMIESGIRPFVIGPFGIGKRSIIEKIRQFYKTFHITREVVCFDSSDYIAKGDSEETLDKMQQFFCNAFKKQPPPVIYLRHFERVIQDAAKLNLIFTKLATSHLFIGTIDAYFHEEVVKDTMDYLGEHHFTSYPIQECSQQEAEKIVEQHITENPTTNFGIKKGAIQLGVFLSSKFYKEDPMPIKAIDLTKRAALETILSKPVSDSQVVIRREDIAKLVSREKGISKEDLLKKESFDSEELSKFLQSKLKGQNHAIKQVVDEIYSDRLNIRDKTKPIASFLFVGPTGVGKTELSKLLAKKLFHKDGAFIKVSCTAYQESHTVSTLLGSPPGYVGDTEGWLTKKIAEFPHSVVLIDEFEKAHSDVQLTFMEAFEEGCLTDRSGKSIDCSNVIFISTTNIGSELYHVASKQQDLVPLIKECLVLQLKPELFNRLTPVIFNSLSEDVLPQIVSLQLEKFKERVAENGVNFQWEDSVVEYFITQMNDQKLGMRDFCKMIDKECKRIYQDVVKANGSPIRGVFSLRFIDGELVVKLSKIRTPDPDAWPRN